MIPFLKLPFLKKSGTLAVSIFIAGWFFGCSGCKAIYSDNSQPGGAFREDATFDWVGTVRPKEDSMSYFGVSDKARAIEEHMGGK